jgi:hypothetical protein
MFIPPNAPYSYVSSGAGIIFQSLTGVQSGFTLTPPHIIEKTKFVRWVKRVSTWYAGQFCIFLYQIQMMMMMTINWCGAVYEMRIDRETEILVEIVSQCHFVHHKFHMT